MKKLIKNLVKVSYVYEKTKIQNQKFNFLVSFTFKNKIIFAKQSVQSCLIKNKILPFFENLPNNKQIRPLFYSHDIRVFGPLKTIARNCKGVALSGKWPNGFIHKRTDFGLSNKSITMIITPDSYYSRNVIKEANMQKIVSFGCFNFGDFKIPEFTYFVMGSKKNTKFSTKFCLLVSSLIKGKMHLNANMKKEQTYCYISYKKYTQNLKFTKENNELLKNTFLELNKKKILKN